MTLDLDFLKPLYSVRGPFASVTLEAGREAGDAEHAVRLRWRGVRSELRAAGADEDTLRALDCAVATPPAEGGAQGQVAVAAGGELLLDEYFHAHPGTSTATWGKLPEVLPLLRSMRTQLPCLVVNVDAAGADIQIRGRSDVVDTAVEGDTHPLHKVRGGGWSHRRIHQRVENVTQHNAKVVVDRVAELVKTVAAEVVVLAGDPQAKANFHAVAPPGVQELLVELDVGSRHRGARPVDEEVDEVLAARAAADDAGRLEAFREQLGQGERAAAGLDATVGCLRKAQVDTVLLEDDGAVERLPALWMGDDIHLLARDAAALAEMGATDQVEVPATAALVGAAATTDADLAFVEPGSIGHRDGVAALLRYSHDPAQAHG
ncbi:MAG: hypothetical protein GEV07_04055 [Streptosporangiales bacterium]|nr:hypothetical protein [Streptosporangiales bacterium]